MNKADKKAFEESWKLNNDEFNFHGWLNSFDKWTYSMELEQKGWELWQAALEYARQPAEPVACRTKCDSTGVFRYHNRPSIFGVITQPLYDPPPAVAVNDRLLSAAEKYFTRYCQDEASEFGIEDTGCTDDQHKDAAELRDAIKAAKAARGE